VEDLERSGRLRAAAASLEGSDAHPARPQAINDFTAPSAVAPVINETLRLPSGSTALAVNRAQGLRSSGRARPLPIGEREFE